MERVPGIRVSPQAYFLSCDIMMPVYCEAGRFLLVDRPFVLSVNFLP